MLKNKNKNYPKLKTFIINNQKVYQSSSIQGIINKVNNNKSNRV